MNNDKSLTIRHAQLLASICISRATNYLQLEDLAIDELVSHLHSLACEQELSEWDMRGTQLEVSGRGDPLPNRILERIDESKRSDFSRIIENAVEVGIHDLYGAPTGQVVDFLRNCIRIIESWGLGGDLSQYLYGPFLEYGPPLSDDDVKRFDVQIG